MLKLSERVEELNEVADEVTLEDVVPLIDIDCVVCVVDVVTLSIVTLSADLVDSEGSDVLRVVEPVTDGDVDVKNVVGVVLMETDAIEMTEAELTSVEVLERLLNDAEDNVPDDALEGVLPVDVLLPTD